jgi:hypothetical protein
MIAHEHDRQAGNLPRLRLQARDLGGDVPSHVLGERFSIEDSSGHERIP